MKFSSWILPPVLALVLTTALTVAAPALAHPHGHGHDRGHRHDRVRRHGGRIALSNHISLGKGPSSRQLASEGQSSTAAPAGEAGTVLFEGDQLRDYPLLQEAPGAISEVPNPLGGSESVLKMTVSNNDVAPITPSTR